MSDNEISTKYAELLPQLSRSATRCVKLLSGNSSSSSNNQDAAVSEQPSKWPQGEEYEFHKAFRGFNSFIRNTQKQHDDLLQHISVCYRDYVPGNNDNNNKNKNVNPLDAVDALFENVDHLLDSVRGVRVDADKQEEIRIGVTGLGGQNTSSKKKSNEDGAEASSSSSQQQHSDLLTRPQDTFAVPVDNFAEEYHHFIADPTATAADAHHRKYSAKPGQQPSQHLIPALDKFNWPADHLVPPKSDKVFLPLEQTPLTFIDTPELLQSIVDTKLLASNGTTAIAVDVEHHNEHSYLGFTCLIQISTREEDFVVDTIALHDDMWRLAPVFHDPNIVKVLHSATEDVRWLQRDFGLYLVNLFDTAIALQTLRMPHSLAFLVDHICQVKLNKQHQTDDWRQRPLPNSMVQYARQDTHYLLYCWDRLRTMLATADTRGANSVGNLLLYVLNESKRLATIMYVKPPFNPETTWKEVFGRSISGLFPYQLKAIQSLFNWREVRARTVDTSANAIMTNGQLLSIGCRLPSTAAEILRMANPATVEVRKHVRELLRFLEEARSLMTTAGGAAPTAAATNDSAKNNNNENLSLAPVSSFQQDHAIHQPMTGTLPSVVASSSSSRTQDGVIVVDTKNSNATSEDAAVASSAASTTSWMNFLPSTSAVNQQQNNTTGKKKSKKSSENTTSGAWNPQELAKTIPVPIPSGRQPTTTTTAASNTTSSNNNSKTSSDFTKLRRQRNEEEEATADENNKKNEDDEEENVAVQEEEQEGPSKPKNDADASKTKSSTKTELPKSLAEEYGGLGRKTRKKATGSGKK